MHGSALDPPGERPLCRRDLPNNAPSIGFVCQSVYARLWLDGTEIDGNDDGETDEGARRRGRGIAVGPIFDACFGGFAGEKRPETTRMMCNNDIANPYKVLATSNNIFKNIQI
ncbi:hypothetical protein GWI33_005298 [Rhynchophorus ferrugineus]|uniref:Uncharacterized protein n=1 Tax=Rhynchophorus ferrugineus TaxID=354439 RepID=A0A834MI35_RHYFE|nr:hypothetical protein GWI33_005298 [Rhynchophorus ferrugineus]